MLLLAIHYSCRHCGVSLGTVDKQTVQAEQLGFHKLNEEERHEMIQYDNSGNVYVKAICEDCHESLERNPDYYQQDFLIH